MENKVKVNEKSVVFNGEKFNKRKLNNKIKKVILNELDYLLDMMCMEMDSIIDTYKYIVNKKDMFENCDVEDDVIYLDNDGCEFSSLMDNINCKINNKLNLFCGGDIIELSNIA